MRKIDQTTSLHRFIGRSELPSYTGVAEDEIDTLIHRMELPEPIKVGTIPEVVAGYGREYDVIAWDAEDIAAWQERRLALRDAHLKQEPYWERVKTAVRTAAPDYFLMKGEGGKEVHLQERPSDQTVVPIWKIAGREFTIYADEDHSISHSKIGIEPGSPADYRPLSTKGWLIAFPPVGNEWLLFDCTKDGAIWVRDDMSLMF